MYTLRKGNKILKQSSDFKSCALELNRITGFAVVRKCELDSNRDCWIEYKDYSLKLERKEGIK